MKLIDIIRNVILEEVRDEESGDVDVSSDVDREPEDREREDREPEDREPEDREPEDIEREEGEGCEEYITIMDYPEDMIPDRCRRFVRDYQEREGIRRPESRPSIGNWVCKDPVRHPGCEIIRTESDVRLITSYGFPFYRSQDECIEASPCRGVSEPRTRPTRPTTQVRPTTQTRPTTEPTTPQGTEGIESTETQTIDVPKIEMNTKYDGDDEIKDIKNVQSNKFIKIVQDKLVKQLELQPPQVKQKLKQFNIQPKNMSYLVPLSNATGTLMLKMELDGLNLPLMMVLYKNTEGLYKSMTNNKQFTQKQASPVTGAIDYKNFWKWNDEIYKGWGPWLKVNVANNFPEISRNTFPSLSF